MFAKSDISKGEIILEIPKNYMITYEDAKEN
jgi:hypothetical protein